MYFKHHIRTDGNTRNLSFKNYTSQVTLMCTEHDLYWQVIRFTDSPTAPVYPDKTPLHVTNGDDYMFKGNK